MTYKRTRLTKRLSGAWGVVALPVRQRLHVRTLVDDVRVSCGAIRCCQVPQRFHQVLVITGCKHSSLHTTPRAECIHTLHLSAASASCHSFEISSRTTAVVVRNRGYRLSILSILQQTEIAKPNLQPLDVNEFTVREIDLSLMSSCWHSLYRQRHNVS